MISRDNYLLVQQYLRDLDEVYQLSSSSIGRYRFYLRHLLLWCDGTPFRLAAALRPTFPSYVTLLRTPHGNVPLAAASQKKIIEIGKRFFIWARQNRPKEFSQLSVAWLEGLRPSRTKDTGDDHEYVSLDEVLRLVAVPHEESDFVLIRDKAAAALLFLSGARASAFTTLPISAVDLAGGTLRQWPDLGVATKNGKRATTFLLPVPELMTVAQAWDDLIRARLPLSAPWYAPITTHWGDQSIEMVVPGKNRHLALNKRLRRLFSLAGLPYHSAHKFRHGHAVYGLQHAQTMADYKAVSMNLMHEDIKITDEIYAPILSSEVKDRIGRLAARPADPPNGELVEALSRLSNAELAQLMVVAARRLSS